VVFDLFLYHPPLIDVPVELLCLCLPLFNLNCSYSEYLFCGFSSLFRGLMKSSFSLPPFGVDLYTSSNETIIMLVPVKFSTQD
jgi:hypothetical protein